MQLSAHAFFLLCLHGTLAVAEFLIGTYPPPLDLSSNQSLVAQSWKNLTASFDAYLKENETAGSEAFVGVKNVTFSLGLFSLHDPAATKLQYHYASPETVNAVNGTNKVDGDSIYRMASVTKLITVFAGLLELSDAQWNTPLSEVFPVLGQYARDNDGESDPIETIQWDHVTPWSLANQLSGFPAGGLAGLDQLAALAAEGIPDAFVEAYGFSPLNASELGPCGTATDPSACTLDAILEDASSLSPSFLPWTSPSYTNPGFMLLGLAIPSIANKSMDDIYLSSVFTPLGMGSSRSSNIPPANQGEIDRSVVVGDPTLWFSPGGLTTPSGGLLSTINDLSKFGINLLNSTLLPQTATHKWMKPTTFTPSLNYAVGAPWEIYRYIHPSTGKVTDLYTKLGDSGPYGGILVLIPEYNAGFSLLNGAANDTLRSSASLLVLDSVAAVVLPALEAQAAAEAARNFVGTYVSADSTINSSVTVSFNKSTVVGSVPALSLSGWISNSTDSLSFFGGELPRLLPTIPNQLDGPGQVALKASVHPQLSSYVAASELGTGPFTGFYSTNGDWLSADSTPNYYNRVAVNLFVFDVDEDGRATAVTPAATKLKLERKGDK
jgi:CubicO group peptidase (beta-lactamase class C family)